jgi:hypothetical protein
VAVAENVVVADRRGEVVLLGIQTGEPLAAPFIMPTRLDSDRARRVSMAAAGKSEIVITDGQSRIYRLGLKEVPSPRLAVLAEEPLAHPIGSEIAVVGSIIFSADEMGEITARNVADLKPVKSWPLGVRVQWGPIQAGAATLAATDRELICFDSKPELVWRKPLPTGVPVGSALTQGADFVLASMTGTLWRVDRQSGEVKKSFDLGEPLASGPVAFDKHWTIAAVDGSLLFIAGQ